MKMPGVDPDWLEVSAILMDAVRKMGMHPDIPDRKAREQWVKARARNIFRKQGGLMRTLTLRTADPAPKLLTVSFDLPYELADYGGGACTALATFFRAQQLYLSIESWWAIATPEEIESGRSLVQPRHRPDRREGLMVTAEDPCCEPAMRAWAAEITRDEATGIGLVGPWTEDFKDFGGRLVYMLPASAYEAAGVKVPNA
jgi:hypothetical protein